MLAVLTLLTLTNAHAPTNVSLPDLANSFWTSAGLKMPSKQLVETVQKAKLPVVDSVGHRREIILMTIASEFAFQRLFDVFLQSLANITFMRPDGRQDSLARHLVVRCLRAGHDGTWLDTMPWAGLTNRILTGPCRKAWAGRRTDP